MKKFALWIIVLFLSLTTAACNYRATPNNYGTDGNMTNNNAFNDNVTTKRALNDNTVPGNGYNNYAPFRYDGNTPTQGNNTDPIGFSRSTNAEIRRNGTGNFGDFFINRDLLARMVSNVSVIAPGVDSCVTAVTDRYILIGIRTNNQANNNTNDTLRWVKMAADSVSPGYFKIYATADAKLVERIERLNNMTIAAISGANNEVDRLVRDMGGAPNVSTKQQAPNGNGTNTNNNDFFDEL